MSLFCTITPTRGDRPELLEFCKHQLKRMTVRPEHSYFIDYEPTANVVDLTPRIKEGIRRAQRDGFDQVFIIEDDDYYSPQYFEAMCFNKNTPANFLGIQRTIYYNL